MSRRWHPGWHPGWPPRWHSQDRAIWALALPALGALVAEPLFLLADSAVVGTLGTVPLAGLAAAGALLSAAVGVFVFLAYATTAAVARRTGAGDLPGALAQGVDGAWLALGLGAATGAAGWVAAPQLVEALGTPADVVPAAVTYLRWSLPGLPGMLLVLAATGVLRGLRDTRTPLRAAVAGALANAVLDVVLVLGLDAGLAGSAASTALVQTAAGAWLAGVVVRGARRHGVRLRPSAAGVRRSATAGAPLVVRTLALRAALLVTTAVAATQGSAALAAHQVVSTLWGLLALTLDAIAIAAQALTGTALGAGDVAGARAATSRSVRWGVVTGTAVGLALLACAPVLPALFSDDPRVRTAITAALVVVAVAQSLAGWVFVLDGVLIGAGDARYLAATGVLVLLVYLPLAEAVRRWAPDGTAGLVLLWCAFAGGFMAARAVPLALRARGTAWMVTGAVR
ncbi:MATE family efflux transporter [Quadrisphaera sp. DSM 44207]|uniref:MATE family efflux transporter n=1 Tax=Quadrisphaera sp. DSM 44207 TaxID=1881057 RepID=UPI0008830EB0|nr:MATE family efflux transporter [Quadrisphaera sp. DSM 44207]SDQ23763.1 putative efflux protein, MATE family [Quadrisphaera sp. DSM 44207]